MKFEETVVDDSMALFLEATGSLAPLQLNIESQGSGGPTLITLHQPFALIGRHSRADVILYHAKVGRRHAYLQRLGGRLFCLDLHSPTGTYWESGRKASGWIEDEQAIRVGSYWIRPQADGEVDPLTGGRRSQRPAAAFIEKYGLPDVIIEFINRAGSPVSWRMAPMLALVGKAPECRVHLVGETVSQFHCSLIRTPLGLWVVDLLGRGGTLVNDDRVRFCRLVEGDVLQIGRFLLRIHYPSPPLDRLPRPTTLQTVSAAPATSPNPIPVVMTHHVGSDPVLTQTQEIGPPPEFLVPEVVCAESNAPPGRDLVLVRDEPAALPPALPAHLVESLLAPITEQLGQMQQQMFDQFQQAMIAMFHMFSTLHQDQLDAIRDELAGLHELNDEVKKVQAELAALSAAQAQPPQVPSELTADLQRIREDLAQLATLQADRSGDLEIQQKIEKLQAEITHLAGLQTQASPAEELLRTELQTLQENLARLAAAQAQPDPSQERLQAELERLRADLAQLDPHAPAAQLRENLQQELQIVRAELAALAAPQGETAKQVQAELQRLAGDLARLAAANHEPHPAVQGIQQELQQLRKDVATIATAPAPPTVPAPAITEALHQVQEELARVAAAQAKAPTVPDALQAELQRLREEMSRLASTPPSQPSKVPPISAPRPAPASAAKPAAGPKPSGPAAAESPKPTPPAPPPPRPAASAGPATDRDMHGWLTQRLATLQQERQSRWQKIMGFLKR